MNNSRLPSSRARVALALGLVYVIWGSTYLAIRVAVSAWPPFFMAAIRFLSSGLALYGFLRWRGTPRPSRVEFRSAAIVGLFLLVGGNGAVVWGERNVPSGLAALLVSVVPLWMAVADWARPGGRLPSGRTIVGLALGLVGLVLLLGVDVAGAGPGLSAGIAALVLASPLWAIGSVYSKRAPLPASPFMATACEMMAGGLGLAVVSVATRETRAFTLASVTPQAWAALVYLILFGSLVGYTAYVYALANASLSVASTYAFVNPVVAVLLGWWVLSEPVGARTLIAGLVVVAAVALITTAPRPRSSSRTG